MHPQIVLLKKHHQTCVLVHTTGSVLVVRLPNKPSFAYRINSEGYAWTLPPPPPLAVHAMTWVGTSMFMSSCVQVDGIFHIL
jgi:hypothetical protein